MQRSIFIRLTQRLITLEKLPEDDKAPESGPMNLVMLELGAQMNHEIIGQNLLDHEMVKTFRNERSERSAHPFRHGKCKAGLWSLVNRGRKQIASRFNQQTRGASAPLFRGRQA